MGAVNYPPLGETLIKVGISFALGALIGVERERLERPAGLRTHILVCLGACLAMMVSKSVAGELFDPARVAAGVVTGIGFLGAGTIIRSGDVVRGLTTAASVWAIAVVGLAVGYGWYIGAIIFTVVQFLTLAVLRIVDYRLAGVSLRAQNFYLDLTCRQFSFEAVRQRLNELDSRLDSVEFRGLSSEGEEILHLTLTAPEEVSSDAIQAVFSSLPGVTSVHWHRDSGR